MQNHRVLDSSSVLKPSQHFATSADLFTECIRGWGCLFISRESVFNLPPNNSNLLEKLWQPSLKSLGPCFSGCTSHQPEPNCLSAASHSLPWDVQGFLIQKKRLSLNYILQHCPVLSFLHIQVSRADDFLLSQMETLI